MRERKGGREREERGGDSGYVVPALMKLNVLQRNNNGSYSLGVGAPGTYFFGGRAFTY